MKPGTKLTFLIVAFISFWGAVIACAFVFNDPKDKAKNLAKEALEHSVDNPDSLKIIAVSEPDSVFGREYITSDEKLTIAMSMMKLGESVMNQTDCLTNIDLENKGMTEMMERQMSCLSALRSLVSFDSDEEAKERPFSGWKVKIEYEAVSESGNRYRSEYWFILDKEARFVVQSFEIPLI